MSVTDALTVACCIVAGLTCVAVAFYVRRLDAEALELPPVAERIPARVPEHVVRFHGGPCDGARLTMTETLTRHLSLRPMDGGEYVFDSIVSLPDGGSVISKEWHAGRPSSRPVPGCPCDMCAERRKDAQ